MTDNTPPDALPAKQVKRKGGISAVWLLPLLAVILGGWLAYKQFTEAGVNVVITFSTGEGVEAGKTEVRYKGITVGKVEELNVQPDLQSVAAQVTMNKRTEQALRDDTQFWLVKPELSVAGVKELDTLVSGNYIAMRPGESKKTRYHFDALEEPPPAQASPGDLEISLLAPTVGSLHRGSPIHYRKLQVGEIVDYTLSDDNERVIFQAHIDAEHKHLLHDNSRFWNTSGLSVSGDLNSIEVNTDSLASIILGGISFDNPTTGEPGPQATNDSVFDIHKSYAEANTGIRIEVAFPSAEGIKANHTEVRYKGMTAGKVVEIDMKPDYSGVVTTISIDPLAKVLLNESTSFWQTQPEISLSKISGLSTLLTGSHIEMDFDPNGQNTETKTQFTALSHSPSPRKDKPGLYIELTASGLEGITRSSDIYYRNVSVGTVIDYRLNEQNDEVILDVHIPPKYRQLITDQVRFYQTSGIEVSAGLQGVELNTESLASVLNGGIGLYRPDSAGTQTADDGERFSLYGSLDEARTQGPKIQIHFADADGLSAGAEVRYLGVPIGTVDALHLNHPEPGVTATVTLESHAQTFSTEGTQFWRVKPNLGLSGVDNLSTLVFGQYIAAEPGDGEAYQKTFAGREQAPDQYRSHNGLTLTLTAPTLASLKEGKSVFYRKIPVGRVTGFELGEGGNHVNIFVHIDPRYAPLVRGNSHFWDATGIDFDFGWLSGASLRTGSIQSLIAGGIAFATPGDKGAKVKDGQTFALHDSPAEGWENWAPDIPLKRGPAGSEESVSVFCGLFFGPAFAPLCAAP